MSNKDLFSLFHIPSPCTQDWNSMRGDDRIRFCEHCQLSVTDISEMNRKQFRRLIKRSGQRLCVRYVLPKSQTQAPSLTLHKIGRKAGILAASAFTASISLPNALGNTSPTPVNRSSVPACTRISSVFTQVLPGTGSISGLVFDPQGAVIADATVSLTSMETNQVTVTISDSTGLYRFDGLQPGTYNLKFQANGFAVKDVPNLTVRSDDNNRIDQTLSIETITATVEVTASIPEYSVSGAAVMVSVSQPLVKAADSDDLNSLNEALTINPDPNVRDQHTGANALECAVRNANREIIQALLWAKADVNARDTAGQTPLMMLGEQATNELVWDLLNAGARVNLRDKDGETALMAVAQVNNSEVLKTILDAGAQINITNNEGKTALMFAAEEGFANNLRILIMAGADVNIRDKAGKTALDYALHNERPAAIRILKHHGAITFEQSNKDQ